MPKFKTIFNDITNKKDFLKATILLVFSDNIELLVKQEKFDIMLSKKSSTITFKLLRSHNTSRVKAYLTRYYLNFKEKSFYDNVIRWFKSWSL